MQGKKSAFTTVGKTHNKQRKLTQILWLNHFFIFAINFCEVTDSPASFRIVGNASSVDLSFISFHFCLGLFNFCLIFFTFSENSFLEATADLFRAYLYSSGSPDLTAFAFVEQSQKFCFRSWWFSRESSPIICSPSTSLLACSSLSHGWLIAKISKH